MTETQEQASSPKTEVYFLRDPDMGIEDEQIECASLHEARKEAEAWIDGGDWDTTDGTVYAACEILDADGDLIETYTKAIEPSAPACDEADEHEWIATHEIEGGLEENPGVFANGGGVIIHDHCQHCGQRRIRDTWAQNCSTGEQGLFSIEYPDGRVEIDE